MHAYWMHVPASIAQHGDDIIEAHVEHNVRLQYPTMQAFTWDTMSLTKETIE